MMRLPYSRSPRAEPKLQLGYNSGMTSTIGKQFMRETQIARLAEQSEQRRGLPQPPLELPYTGDGPLIDLPRPENLPFGNIDLIQAINARRTRRVYRPEPLSLAELSFLLWCTQGVRERTDRPATLRPVPSAGARHAFETILLANRVDGLPVGLYRFLAGEHCLARLPAPEDITARLTVACREQDQVSTSAVTFIWVAVLARMRWRYSERGYRFLHLDAGHVCQNLYLAAEAVNCGVCAIGGFDDEALNRELGLDGEEQFAIYLGTVGKKE
jgi:SagB-type dehydrogenase family enzyme